MTAAKAGNGVGPSCPTVMASSVAASLGTARTVLAFVNQPTPGPVAWSPDTRPVGLVGTAPACGLRPLLLISCPTLMPHKMTGKVP